VEDLVTIIRSVYDFSLKDKISPKASVECLREFLNSEIIQLCFDYIANSPIDSREILIGKVNIFLIVKGNLIFVRK
jgi:hypothetical protein